MRLSTTKANLMSPPEADRGQRRDFTIISSVSLVLPTEIILAYLDDNYITAFGCTYITVVATSFIASLSYLRIAIRKGRSQRRNTESTTSFFVPQSLVIWEFFTISLTAFSTIAAIILQIVGTRAYGWFRLEWE